MVQPTRVFFLPGLIPKSIGSLGVIGSTALSNSTAEPLGVNGSTGPTVLSDGPKSGFAGSVGAIGLRTLGQSVAIGQLGPHGQTTRQETILPNPLHAMTLQDSRYRELEYRYRWQYPRPNDSVSSFSDIFNMSINRQSLSL
ncbi:hypothetical protein Tco_1447535 [Tanacetum coccineum]|uniref:Uncharacterized protein n=1 Tax=Tanacetum coccineum TaxID=301880 RepID=A0ABQ5FSG9_9ASTR